MKYKFIFIIFLISPLIYAQNNISIKEAKASLNADIYWEPLSEELLFSKNDMTASILVDSNLILYSNKTYSILETPPNIENGEVRISAECLQEILNFFENRTSTEIGYHVGAILIDPGHGGRDAGCVGSYTENGKTHILYEKNIALSVSLDLYNRLKKTYPEKNIMLTRDSDTYPTLPERVKMANSIKVNKNEAILYISIHANATFNIKAQGFEVWYLPPEYRRNLIDKEDAPKDIHSILNSMLEEEYTMESVLMSKYVLDGLEKEIGDVSRNRGIREAEYIVVKNVKMPSILVELGFVSNKEEAKRLNTPSYLKKCTTGIYNGLVSFIYQFESSRGFIAK
ncbi:MAG: N-acetylmuramoyl-L-alanine amidase [Treponema sp.]